MKIENLQEGMVLKSYRDLCKVLEIKIKGGNGKQVQIKELERFVAYHKEGNKFIIDEIYDEPQPKEENLTNTSKYKILLERKLLELLRDSKDNEICFSKYILSENLGLTKENYRKYNYNQKEISEKLKVRKFDVQDFYNSTNSSITYTIMNLLETMENKGLVDYKIVQIARDSEDNSCYEITNQKTLVELLEIKNSTIKKLKCESINEIIYKDKYGEYIKEFNKIIKEKYNFEYIFKSYKIFSSQKIINESLKNCYKDISTDDINIEFFNKTILNIAKRHVKATESQRVTKEDSEDSLVKNEYKQMIKATRTFYRGLESYVDNSISVAEFTIKK